MKIKEIYLRYKTIIHNLSYLTILKALTIILPLVIFPYLFKMLGDEKYGLIMWAFSISQLFIVAIRFGFDTIGIKLASQHRSSTLELSKILSKITYLKICIFALSLLAFALLQHLVTNIHANVTLFMFFLIYVFFESMLPTWYFQGIENFKIASILLVTGKIIFTLLSITLIHEGSNYISVVFFYIAGSAAAFFAAHYMIFKHKIALVRVGIKDLAAIVKESVLVFTSGVGTSLRDNLTAIFIEKYLGFSAVAYFDLAVKIVNIFLTPFNMLVQVFYPYMAKTKKVWLSKKVLWLGLAVAFAIIAAFLPNTERISLLFYGKADHNIIAAMNILVFIIPFGFIAHFMADDILLVFNKAQWYLYGAIFALLAYFAVFALSSKASLESFVYMYFIYFVAEAATRTYAAKNILWSKKC